ncbi:MAG TPA: galactosyltransferase-related protein [Bacillales bacterium]|nr:galactosyltransferase-related protein [Bacillales bacterium]
MLNQVSVLIPYKPDNGIRDDLFKWVKAFYEETMPEVEFCVGKALSEPFNRSRAINLAAKQATRDILVIADSDIIFDPEILTQAIPLLDQQAWIIPYSQWFDFTEPSTKKLLTSAPQWPLPKKIEVKNRFKNRAYQPVSGVIVVTRENFTRVKGFDERFVGWGREDDAFRCAMDTICGPYKRLCHNAIYHLWHPKVGGKRNPNIRNNNKLLLRYKNRSGNVKRMEKLIHERSKKSD